MIYMTYSATACTDEIHTYEDIAFPQRAHVMPDTFRNAKTGLAYPPHNMFNKVITAEAIKYVTENPVKGKTAFIFAAGTQGWVGTQSRYDKNPEAELHYKTKLPFITLTTIYAGRVAAMFRVHDHVSTDASACASSLKVLMDMQNLMFYYGFDRAIILSGENSVCVQSLEFFGDSKACLTLKDEDGGKRKPSAFDDVNNGFYVGQGAALTIFEKEHSNMRPPLARFMGAYTSAEDNTNPLGQSECGEGYSKAIDGALSVAKLHKNKVRLVKTHGTGTLVNNAAEKSALLRSLNEFVATSYKPRIGHTLSASGLLETGLLLDDLKSGFVPKICNRTTNDDIFLSDDVSAVGGPFLSLAAGMGNVFSAALFSTEV